MFTISISELLKYRNKIYPKTTVLNLATAFRDYLHAFTVHSQKPSDFGTGGEIATAHCRADIKKIQMKFKKLKRTQIYSIPGVSTLLFLIDYRNMGSRPFCLLCLNPLQHYCPSLFPANPNPCNVSASEKQF